MGQLRVVGGPPRISKKEQGPGAGISLQMCPGSVGAAGSRAVSALSFLGPHAAAVRAAGNISSEVVF